jgi:hypothetical protein
MIMPLMKTFIVSHKSSIANTNTFYFKTQKYDKNYSNREDLAIPFKLRPIYFNFPIFATHKWTT